MSAHDLVKLHQTPRQKKIERLEAYVEGTQYDGLKHFLDQSDPAVPILERKPCVIVPIVEDAVRSHANMLFGEGRFPKIKVERQLDENEVEDHELDDEAKQTLRSHNRVVQRIVEKSQLDVSASELLKDALKTSECFAVCWIDEMGEANIDVVEPCHVFKVDRDARGRVTRLEIKYPYVDCEQNALGQWIETAKIFRRVIDDKSDITFFPIVAPPSPASAVAWIENKELTLQHQLGFCPVISWRRCHAIHARHLDKIDALNRSASQEHRASLYVGDPQQWETGVGPRENVSPMGRIATLPQGVDDGRSEDNYRRTSQKSARRRGVSTVIGSRNPDAKFGLLTLPGDALTTITNNVRNLKDTLHKAFGIVDFDLADAGMAKDASGKALELICRRQIDFDNDLRVEVERNLILPIIHMFFKILSVDFMVVDDLKISLVWGLYFQPTPIDAKAAVKAASDAFMQGFCTKLQAIEYVSKYISIEDVHETLETILQAPTPEQALKIQGLQMSSETFRQIWDSRVAKSLLGSVDDVTMRKIENEIKERQQNGNNGKMGTSDRQGIQNDPGNGNGKPVL